MPAVTRSSSKANSVRAAAQLSDTKSELTDPTADQLMTALEGLDDEAPVHGREAKLLRDATSSAIAQVWSDTQAASALLSNKINECNAALVQKLNESFAVVGQRMEGLPQVAVLQQDSPTPKIAPFSGSSDQSSQFKLWLRRLEDVMRMRPTPMSEEQKANFLIGHLEGVAREKVEELPAEDRIKYDTLVKHLTTFFESPHQRYMARQRLSVCRQEPGESCSAFSNRILDLVRAATSGQDTATQKERILEEFVARLRGDIRYFVKLDNPTTFEQAISKAQTVEQLLSEAAAERLISPSFTPSAAGQVTGPQPVVQVASYSSRTQHPPSGRGPRRQPTANRPQQSPPPRYSASQGRTVPPTARNPTPPVQCFRCGGLGHFQRDCPSGVPGPRRPFRGAGWSHQANRGSFSKPAYPGPGDVRALGELKQDTSADDARLEIARLSLALKDQQSQLEQSQARVKALLQRNEELARSSLNQTATPSACSALPDVRLLFLCVLAIATMGSQVSAADVWLCPRENPSSLFFVPDSYNCSGLLPNSTTQIERLSLQIFRPNVKLYSSPAFFCRIIRHSVTYSVNFFGARREAHSETHLTVSSDECRQMARHHRCTYGTLGEQSGLWRTRQELSFEFPSAPFGCCVDNTVTAINCYLTPTTVYARYSEPAPQSPVGDLSRCAYKDGVCTLQDGSTVIWTPDTEEECYYTFVTRMSGLRANNVWLSDSKEFSLSWNDNSSRVSDCFKQFILTDQGYAILISLRRVRNARKPEDEVGAVTSNQLSAQLLAVESSIHITTIEVFRQALETLCKRTSILTIALAAALRSSPTLTMRHLLGRSDIMATHESENFIQVRRCIKIPPTAIEFIPFNGTCYSAPIVTVTHPSGSHYQAFLEPSTRILRNTAAVINCEDSADLITASPDKITRFSPLDGSVKAVTPDVVTTLLAIPQVKPLSLAPPLTIFHNLVLTNFSDVMGNQPLREMWTALDQEKLVQHFSTITTPRSSATSATQISYSLSNFIPSFSFFEMWSSLCCLVVSGGILKSIMSLYIRLYHPALVTRLQLPFVSPHAAPAHSLQPLPAPIRAQARVDPLQARGELVSDQT